MTGLIWYPKSLGLKYARHTCEISDRLETYGWIMHDGFNFGHELITDSVSNVKMDIKFIKNHDGSLF